VAGNEYKSRRCPEPSGHRAYMYKTDANHRDFLPDRRKGREHQKLKRRFRKIAPVLSSVPGLPYSILFRPGFSGCSNKQSRRWSNRINEMILSITRRQLRIILHWAALPAVILVSIVATPETRHQCWSSESTCRLHILS